MSETRNSLLCLASLVALLATLGMKATARGAYESAEYTVLKSDGPFEIRKYPDLMLASTKLALNAGANDGGFMRLFQYISGANDDQQKVAMTTPVFMEADSGDDQGRMGFVVPKEVSEKRVPEPTNEDVRIRKRTGGRFAVIKFSGRMNDESIAEAVVKLREWMSEGSLKSTGTVETAGYDPPWTPGPKRRNEVLMRLK